MGLRLGEQVICGEIFNNRKYSVHGWLELRDWEHPLVLQLTGNCDPDLAGWHFRFQARSSEDQDDCTAQQSDTEIAQSERIDLSVLAMQQIGPTGTMTAARKVKTADCSPRELYLRHKLDEPPPMEWKRCLYLEWFSQNGRVVVELADPVIELVEFTGLEGGSGSESTPASPAEQDHGPPAAPGITSMGIDGEGDAEIHDESPELAQQEEEADEDDDDPFQLIPDELQRQFEADAQQTDLKLQFECDDEDKPRCIREMELMDDLIENSPGVPLDMIFDGPLKLHPPDQLGDQEAEQALKLVLAELALFGISLDVCEHFTPRDAYRLLLDEICPEERAYPELRHTQWVQSFSTSEYCPQCEAEFERDHEEYQRRRKENPGDDPPGTGDIFEDDIPF